MAKAPLASDRQSTQTKSRARRIAILVAPIAAGVIAGGLFGLRLLGLWTRGPREQEVPTAGLLYLGAFFLIAGLVYLYPGVWRGMHDGNVRAMRSWFGSRQPAEPATGWRRSVRIVEDWFVAREERERDSQGRQRRVALTGIVAGATIITYALVR